MLATVLAAVDAGHGSALDLLEQLVAIPSTGGSAGEVEIQHVLAEVLAGDGLDVDLWPLDLDALTADPDFPGMEVERRVAATPGAMTPTACAASNAMDVSCSSAAVSAT